MTESRLERTMMRFLQQDFDVNGTTIIESGLDIANVNTILIDHLQVGPSTTLPSRQVGRSIGRLLLFDAERTGFSEVAEKRLEAIGSLVSSGRGLRSLWRPRDQCRKYPRPWQHGNIAAVGFEICKLLEEAVKENRETSASNSRIRRLSSP